MSANIYPSINSNPLFGLQVGNLVISGKTDNYGYYKYSGTLNPGYYLLVGQNVVFQCQSNASNSSFYGNANANTYGTAIIRIVNAESNFRIYSAGEDSTRYPIIANNPTTFFFDGTYFCGTSNYNNFFSKTTDGITYTYSSISWPGAANTVNSGAYNASVTNKYILVGGASYILTSTDSITWTSRTSGLSTGSITDVQINSSLTNKYVVINNAGSIISSTDGITWTARTSGTTSSLWCLATSTTATNKYVAVGAGGIIVYSTDGATWSTATFNYSVANLGYVEFLNGSYWATSDYGSIFNSTDGITWTIKFTTSGNFGDIAYYDNLYWATDAGVAAVSTDGNTWNLAATPMTSLDTGSANKKTKIILGNNMAIGAKTATSPAYFALYSLPNYTTY